MENAVIGKSWRAGTSRFGVVRDGAATGELERYVRAGQPKQLSQP